MGKAYKYFAFTQSNDSQTGESLCESNKRKYTSFFIVNAMR
ncbi:MULTISPECIES: hypothetical protein [unclassified Ruminococcus]|nr:MULTISPECIES: hypothetical protein [unclassified Ruminococcus]